MGRDYSRDWVKASHNRGGVNVHIPKGILDYLPDDFEAEDLMVKRYPSSKRNTIMLTVRSADEIDG